MIEAVKQDAREYGLHIRGGDWRLALLVARNVEKDKGNPSRTRNNRSTSDKVSLKEFARLSSTGHPRVARHLEMWERAAEAGHVPAAATLNPGDEVDLDVEKLPPASDFYTSVSGGYNGSPERQPTAKQAKAVLEQLPPEEAAAVAAEVLDTDEVTAAMSEEADDHVFSVTTKRAGSRGKTKKAKANRKLHEMTVVLDLIGVLGQIRDLAKEDADSPLIKECKNLMRETLDILDQIEEASDPDAVEKMLSDFGDFLSAQ